MVTVSSSEARTHMYHLIRRASRGEAITITRYGKPVAKLIRAPEALERDPEAVKEAANELLEFGKKHSLGDLSIREMIDEGRRY